MKTLANNPYCVWFDSKVRTFKSERAAEAFAKRHAGEVGVWDDTGGWWCPVHVTSEELAVKAAKVGAA